jgi:N-methylhydantoinase B/oxoprolinase/acetone carboxylase alpha subunit
VNPSVGVRGGSDGGNAVQKVRRPDGSIGDELGSYAQLRLRHGEILISHTRGGGGYGPPGERDPLRVAKDVREGWVTRTRARGLPRGAHGHRRGRRGSHRRAPRPLTRRVVRPRASALRFAARAP